MRQFFTGAQEWIDLAGETFPGCAGCGPGASRPRMKEWVAPPGRPNPGPEPRLRPLRPEEDVNAAMTELNQRHKEWEAARQGLEAWGS